MSATEMQSPPAPPPPAPTLDPRTPPIDLLPLIGPDAPAAGACMSIEQALAYCRGLASSHYENFSVLTSLVPERLRDDFAAVYAFCRWADDLGDETGQSPDARARSERLLAWWREGLNACFSDDAPADRSAGASAHPVFVALRATRKRHPHLTARPFADLIDAFVQDQRVTRYQTWDQCVDYCTRSANPVGRIVLTLGGYAPPEADPANADRYRMSDATCTALQLINFWQDVRRDLLERDRVYLPADDTGISVEKLRLWIDRPNDPAARVPYIRALRPLVERTAALFDIGRPLPSTLDKGLAPVVWLFGAGGDAILNAVMRSGCTTLWDRPRLNAAQKGWLVARAFLWSRLAGGKTRE